MLPFIMLPVVFVAGVYTNKKINDAADEADEQALSQGVKLTNYEIHKEISKIEIARYKRLGINAIALLFSIYIIPFIVDNIISTFLTYEEYKDNLLKIKKNGIYYAYIFILMGYIYSIYKSRHLAVFLIDNNFNLVKGIKNHINNRVSSEVRRRYNSLPWYKTIFAKRTPTQLSKKITEFSMQYLKLRILSLLLRLSIALYMYYYISKLLTKNVIIDAPSLGIIGSFFYPFIISIDGVFHTNIVSWFW